MKNFFSSNLKVYRKENKLTQDEAATALGFKRTTYANYESQHTEPDIETFLLISSKFGISIDNLLKVDFTEVRFEDGKPVFENETKGKVSGKVSGKVYPILEAQNTVFTIAGEPDTHYGNKVIPITDIKVAAGSGIYAPEHTENLDSIGFPRHLLKKDGTYLCVRAKGESMAPRILDSDLILMRLLDKSEWSSISKATEMVYVVSDIENKGYLKRVKNRWNKGFITLMSDNLDKANYPNFNLQFDEITSIWVVEFAGGFKLPNINAQYFDRLRDLEDKVEDLEKLKGMVTELYKKLPAK